ALKTFYNNLKPGGIGVFDLWFGPAVLIDPPKAVSKTVEENGEKIIRNTTPELDPVKQTVTVNFETLVTLKNGESKTNTESHKMRFLFYQELSYFIKNAELETLGIFPFLKLDGLPTTDNWNMSVILKKP